MLTTNSRVTSTLRSVSFSPRPPPASARGEAENAMVGGVVGDGHEVAERREVGDAARRRGSRPTRWAAARREPIEELVHRFRANRFRIELHGPSVLPGKNFGASRHCTANVDRVASRRRRATCLPPDQTSSSCWPTTWATPTSAATAARSTRPTSTHSAATACGFTQFYNTARCSPSRASLLTGLHPHQTGLGILTNNDRPGGYPGTLNRTCPTLAEILNANGYRTALSGKWHLASEVRKPNDAWPTRRGFDRFFGTLTGCGSYYPGTLTRDETNAEHEAATGTSTTPTPLPMPPAVRRKRRRDNRSSCTSRTRRHTGRCTPAPRTSIATAVPSTRAGTSSVDVEWIACSRKASSNASPPPQRARPEPTAVGLRPHKEWQQRRMEVYAAQIERMDHGVGRIVKALREQHALDDTLFFFLSDNGAAEATCRR